MSQTKKKKRALEQVQHAHTNEVIAHTNEVIAHTHEVIAYENEVIAQSPTI